MSKEKIVINHYLLTHTVALVELLKDSTFTLTLHVINPGFIETAR